MEKGKKMPKYINLERARFEAERYFKSMDGIKEDLDTLFCMLQTQDVAPVWHGRWSKNYRSGTTVSEGWVSSCCEMWNERKTRYCPNCGAKMDGEEDDENA